MAFHHRKLLDESYEDPMLEPYCMNIFCDVIKNPNGTCPLKCTSFCDPSNCIIPIEKETTTDLSDPPQKHHHISLFLTISLSILATVVFFFICYATYKLYSRWYNSRRRRRRRSQEEPGPDAFLDEDQGPPMVDHHVWYIRTIGLQPSVISAITIVKYKKGEGIIEGTDCSVCLNEFQEEETLRLLPKCNHAFHIPCIDTWLASHTNCPMCRAGIIINSTTLIPNTEPEEVIIAPNSEQNGEQVVEGSAGVEEDMDSRAQIKPMNRSVSFDSFNVGTTNVGINQRLLRMVTITNEEGSLVKASSSSSSMKRSISCSAKV